MAEVPREILVARGVGAAEARPTLKSRGGSELLVRVIFRGFVGSHAAVAGSGVWRWISNAFGRGGAWIARFAPEHQSALPSFLMALSTGAAPNCCDSSGEVG